ncbi:MAG: XdhC family protein [Candidatus Marinimicrobia bacterium]|nr:XdhC family protein [Candidatus Neomarinimicrobiota bacterium]
MLFKEVRKSVPDANFDLSYIPVGLDIGGTTPHEIAISIIAEMQAVEYHKKSKHLRGTGA